MSYLSSGSASSVYIKVSNVAKVLWGVAVEA
jgi:hypothetical protein